MSGSGGEMFPLNTSPIPHVRTDVPVAELHAASTKQLVPETSGAIGDMR